MTVKDILYSICNKRDIPFSRAAEIIGVSRGSLGNQMRYDDGMRMKLPTIINDFGMLECEIYVVDTQTGEEYVLDGEDEDVELFTSKKRENSW